LHNREQQTVLTNSDFEEMCVAIDELRATCATLEHELKVTNVKLNNTLAACVLLAFLHLLLQAHEMERIKGDTAFDECKNRFEQEHALCVQREKELASMKEQCDELKAVRRHTLYFLLFCSH
jgi:hypothetical protein